MKYQIEMEKDNLEYSTQSSLMFLNYRSVDPNSERIQNMIWTKTYMSSHNARE